MEEQGRSQFDALVEPDRLLQPVQTAGYVSAAGELQKSLDHPDRRRIILMEEETISASENVCIHAKNLFMSTI